MPAFRLSETQNGTKLRRVLGAVNNERRADSTLNSFSEGTFHMKIAIFAPHIGRKKKNAFVYTAYLAVMLSARNVIECILDVGHTLDYQRPCVLVQNRTRTILARRSGTRLRKCKIIEECRSERTLTVKSYHKIQLTQLSGVENPRHYRGISKMKIRSAVGRIFLTVTRLSRRTIHRRVHD